MNYSPPTRRLTPLHWALLGIVTLTLAVGLVGGTALVAGIHAGLITPPFSSAGGMPLIGQQNAPAAPDGYLYSDSGTVVFVTFTEAPHDGPESGAIYTAVKGRLQGYPATEEQSPWTGTQSNGKIALSTAGGAVSATAAWQDGDTTVLLLTYQTPSAGFMTLALHGASYDDYNQALQALQGDVNR